MMTDVELRAALRVLVAVVREEWPESMPLDEIASAITFGERPSEEELAALRKYEQELTDG